MTPNPDPTLILVTGVSGSGKTTLIERLVPILRARGLRVATIKHAHHGFEMDRPGKDSWRHAQAGAEAVCVIAPQQVAWLMATAEALPVEQAVRPMAGRVDLVLVEGFKHVTHRCAIALEPGSQRLAMEPSGCRIGAHPATLTPDELERIAEFCVELTRERHACPPR